MDSFHKSTLPYITIPTSLPIA